MFGHFATLYMKGLNGAYSISDIKLPWPIQLEERFKICIGSVINWLRPYMAYTSKKVFQNMCWFCH